MLVAVQLSVLGLYLPPVFKWRLRYLHPKRSFHCRSRLPCDGSGRGRVGGAGGCPTIRAGIVSPAGVQTVAVVVPIHPRRSFHCRSRLPCDRIGQRARWSCWWLSNYPCWDCISRRCLTHGEVVHSAPDDHFTAGPDCRVRYRPEGALAVLVAVHVSSVHGGSPASAIFGRV